MRILIAIEHPAHVHFFKNIIHELKKNGHIIKIIAIDKDITLNLLDAYDFEYELLGKNYKEFPKKAYGVIKYDYKTLKIVLKFKPDLFLSAGSVYAAHISKIIKKPSIAFIDTEHASLANRLMEPFTDIIFTPSCYKASLNPKKHIRYDGYKELAYLHPNYFKPDSSVLDELELCRGDKYIILRFVSWNANHDVGQYGIDQLAKSEYIAKLERYGRIFISSESKIEKEFEKYKLRIEPEKFHSLLNYAQLYIGESGAVTTEAAIIGTPSIYVSSLVGTMGNFDELEKKYGLVHSFNNSNNAIEMALNLLEDKNLKNKWQSKREKLLREKIDVTKFIIEFIEGYHINNINYVKRG